MSNYSQITSFTPKDSLPTGNPSKVIMGADFDGEFNAISTAIATKADSSTVSTLTTTVAGKQEQLVSGTNIKTVNSTSLLGSGDVAVQATLVSGTNIKTVNSTSLLGSGNVAVGDVVGPSSATDNALARFDGTTGKLVQNSGVTVDDNNNIGIGAAISNAGTNAKALEIGARGVVWASTAANFTSYGTNATLDSGSSWAYKAADYATTYVQTGGGHDWRIAPIGTAGAPITFTIAATLDNTGSFLLRAGAFGYTTGAGGTVTQATSKITTVTLNKPSGKITMASDALGAGAYVTFALNNTFIAATDTLIVMVAGGYSGAAGGYSASSTCIAGAAAITLRNHTGGSLSEAVQIQFNVIKGATA